MADLKGEAKSASLRLDFDRRLLLRFRGSAITSDAERLSRDPAMRWVVGDRAITGCAASASQMGRFETEWLALPENLASLADLPGRWIDTVHRRRPPKMIVLDMDSSESPTYRAQEGSTYNGHFGCTCYHPLFVFNQLGDLEAVRSAVRQRAQCRRLAGRAGAGGRPLPRRREAALFPTIPSSRARSAAFKSTMIPVRIRQTRMSASRPESPAGLFRQSCSTSRNIPGGAQPRSLAPWRIKSLTGSIAPAPII